MIGAKTQGQQSSSIVGATRDPVKNSPLTLSSTLMRSRKKRIRQMGGKKNPLSLCLLKNQVLEDVGYNDR